MSDIGPRHPWFSHLTHAEYRAVLADLRREAREKEEAERFLKYVHSEEKDEPDRTSPDA